MKYIIVILMLIAYIQAQEVIEIHLPKEEELIEGEKVDIELKINLNWPKKFEITYLGFQEEGKEEASSMIGAIEQLKGCEIKERGEKSFVIRYKEIEIKTNKIFYVESAQGRYEKKLPCQKRPRPKIEERGEIEIIGFCEYEITDIPKDYEIIKVEQKATGKTFQPKEGRKYRLPIGIKIEIAYKDKGGQERKEEMEVRYAIQERLNKIESQEKKIEGQEQTIQNMKAELENLKKEMLENFKNKINEIEIEIKSKILLQVLLDSDKRYLKIKSEIVYDRSTELGWLVGPDKDMNWDEAKAWIESIDKEKYGTGWRMPTRKELKSIYEGGKGKCNIDPIFISVREHLWVWSEEKKDSTSVWGINYSGNEEYWDNRSGNFAARAFAVCVDKEIMKELRKETNEIKEKNMAKDLALEKQTSRFKKQPSGIVYDKKTNLEWLVGPDKDTSWDEAKAWVESIDQGKYGTGWRMPTIKELPTIYEPGKGKCNIDPIFVSPRDYLWVWSGELEGSSWYFRFHRGPEFSFDRSTRIACRVFAVRSGRQ